MNESMNFGNIGFSNVSSNNSSEEKKENVAVKTQDSNENEQPSQPKVDLMAGVKEAQEAEKAKEEEAINDFKNSRMKKTNFEKDADNFSQIDFGPLKKYLDDDDITDISYSNNGQLWLKSLSRGVYRAEQQDVDDVLIEKIAFQCSNVMGKTFNMAHPFLDSESAELRMNFVHESIARNGIAVVFRKTPAKIRLEKQKLLNEKYVQLSIHDFLINCVKGHCNIIVCGETGSGKTELIKYLASHTAVNEKLITIEDTLELHLDRIFPQRDIVAMKTNNIASYSDVLVTCMRQNPIWILLSEVRSAEAVTAVRNSISSGHYILSTIHADKAESIPHRMYSLLESNIDVEQFLKTIYRYVQIGVFVRGRYKPEEKRFVREIAGVCEFFVTEDTNEPKFNNIYLKTVGGEETYQEPTKYIKGYLEGQGVDITNLFGEKLSSLAQANEANGIESDVKELDGEIVHIPGKESNDNQKQDDTSLNNNIVQQQSESIDNNDINQIGNNVEQKDTNPVPQSVISNEQLNLDGQNNQPMTQTSIPPFVPQNPQNVQQIYTQQGPNQNIQNMEQNSAVAPVVPSIMNQPVVSQQPINEQTFSQSSQVPFQQNFGPINNQQPINTQIPQQKSTFFSGIINN